MAAAGRATDDSASFSTARDQGRVGRSPRGAFFRAPRAGRAPARVAARDNFYVICPLNKIIFFNNLRLTSGLSYDESSDKD